MFADRFERLFGPPRKPGTPFFTRRSGWPTYFGERPPDWERLAEENQRYADIAASIQRVTEDILLAMVRYLHERTGLRRLCMARGVALNCVANARILREGPFEEIFIQPNAGDGGGALGAALWAYHTVFGHPRKFVMEHAYWGRAYTPAEVRTALERAGVAFKEAPDEDTLIDWTVERLLEGRVVGWFQGRLEWGPRALGHRSILADPRRPDMKDRVNVLIKFREPYRPFAPSVAAEAAPRFFDGGSAIGQYPARFMLYTVPVRSSAWDRIPAVTHVDGSSRIQTVTSAWEPLYDRLIRRFGEATGIPVVLNTSFNLKGEPIVCSPEDALSTFFRSGLEVLVIDRFIVEKPDRSEESVRVGVGRAPNKTLLPERRGVALPRGVWGGEGLVGPF
jgi:carbamoyltransferase